MNTQTLAHPNLSFDVLIIGSGASGLSLAIQLAPQHRIAVFSKTTLSEGSTFYAQGGISAVLDSKDSIESHIADTLTTGVGLCNPDIVRLVVSQGKECINWLVEQGVQFTTESRSDGSNKLHLNREGGHTHRRIVHAADATGKAVSATLEKQVIDHPNVKVFEHFNVVDLIKDEKKRAIMGAYVLDCDLQKVVVFQAPIVVLATGGASKVYLYTSNPDVSTGDGIALAWRAGCKVANMEFMQFHPTCLYHPEVPSFLISEAVRGEGARLRLPDGTAFMQKFDEREELASRDIVARAIDHEMKRLGIDCVYLDISHKSEQFIRDHFPTIHAKCLALNIDIVKQPIPVVPAAHYTCGGVIADRNGRTDISGLYAIGEVACTGLHGANRMASNSLLECLVFAKQAALDIQQQLRVKLPPPVLPEWDESRVSHSDEEVVVAHNWHEIRQFMWDYVGIVRTDKRLERALHRIELLKKEIAEYYGHFRVTSDLLELRNLVIVADLIINSALQRKESRGLHFTLDYPHPNNNQPIKDTVLSHNTYDSQND